MRRPSRDDRVEPLGGKPDDRPAGARDRDRILYCSAFRRLAGVTQVITPEEGLIVHNRLTHSLKVGQVARRIADTLCRDCPDDADKLGGVDPEVAEAAGLAHDLGHPPFGHIAETELDVLARSHDPDGFEGNAQSFRIVSRLAVRSLASGLNLSRATLNSILKYPWFRNAKDSVKNRKWGAYHDDDECFRFARAGYDKEETKSLEAEIMDWADDITYALHDVEDFFRANLIPLDRLREGDERRRFFDEVFQRRNITDQVEQKRLETAFGNALWDLGPREPFQSTPAQRRILRNFISHSVTKYIRAFTLPKRRKKHERRAVIDAAVVDEVGMLKQLTWHYVIRNPALAAQQHGQRTVIRTLFEIFSQAAEAPDHDSRGDILPFSMRDRLMTIRKRRNVNLPLEQTRLVTDLIASMSDAQAIRTYQKLTGITNGSLLDQSLHQSIG